MGRPVCSRSLGTRGVRRGHAAPPLPVRRGLMWRRGGWRRGPRGIGCSRPVEVLGMRMDRVPEDALPKSSLVMHLDRMLRLESLTDPEHRGRRRGGRAPASRMGHLDSIEVTLVWVGGVHRPTEAAGQAEGSGTRRLQLAPSVAPGATPTIACASAPGAHVSEPWAGPCGPGL